MTFILTPINGNDVQVNGWNWRPTLELLRAAGQLDEQTYDRMSANGCGGSADAELAEKFAEVVDTKLAEMNSDERVLADLTISTRNKSGRLDDPEIYSATYEWLQRFSAFCRRSGGFEVM